MENSMESLQLMFNEFSKECENMNKLIADSNQKLQNKLKIDTNNWKSWNVDQIIRWIYNLKDKNNQFAFRQYCMASFYFLFSMHQNN